MCGVSTAIGIVCLDCTRLSVYDCITWSLVWSGNLDETLFTGVSSLMSHWSWKTSLLMHYYNRCKLNITKKILSDVIWTYSCTCISLIHREIKIMWLVWLQISPHNHERAMSIIFLNKTKLLFPNKIYFWIKPNLILVMFLYFLFTMYHFYIAAATDVHTSRGRIVLNVRSVYMLLVQILH